VPTCRYMNRRLTFRLPSKLIEPPFFTQLFHAKVRASCALRLAQFWLSSARQILDARMIVDSDLGNHLSHFSWSLPQNWRDRAIQIRAEFVEQQTMLADIPRNLTHPNKTLVR